MLSPVKIIITGTSLLLNNNIQKNEVFYLDGDYSYEASRVTSSNSLDSNKDIRDFLYKKIGEELQQNQDKNKQ